MSLHRDSVLRDPIRLLLDEFTAAWARDSLAAGAAPLTDAAPALLVVDAFAGRDHPYAPPLAARILGELRSLAARRDAGWAATALLEEDPVKVAWLLEQMGSAGSAAGVTVRVREGGPTSLDAADLVSTPASATLALLDPPTAGHLPLAWVLEILRRPGSAALIRLPGGDLRRLAGFHGMPLADLPPYPRRLAEGFSLLLGDPRHRWFFDWTKTFGAGGAAAAEAEVVAALGARLSAGEGIPARVVRTSAVPGVAEPEYLLLVSAQPAHALLLNQVLFRARNAGRIAWAERDDGIVRHVARGELELFAEGGGGGGAAARDRVVDTVAVAQRLAGRFAGRTVPLDAVLLELLDTDLFVEDVKSALTELRRDGRAYFRSLSAGTAPVAFPRAGTAAAPPRRATGRRRGDSAETLSLALDPSPDSPGE